MAEEAGEGSATGIATDHVEVDDSVLAVVGELGQGEADNKFFLNG